MPALPFTNSVTEPEAAWLGLGPPTCRTRDVISCLQVVVMTQRDQPRPSGSH